MRVLLVPNTAASMVWFRLPFLRSLVAAGHRVWVAAPDGWGVDRIVETGASFLPVFQTQGWAFGTNEALSGSYTDPTRDLRFVRDLRRICQVVRPDLALAYTHKMSVLTPFAARAAGVQHVHGMITGLGYANLRGSLRQEALRQAFHASVRAAAALSDSLILLNRDNLDEARACRLAPASKLFLMDGEGVDVEHFAADPHVGERGALTFLMAARLVRYKGVYEFVAAARALRTSYPRARFVLAGASDGNHPSSVSPDDLAAWRAEGIVELPGHVADLRPLLREAHAFVLPSSPTEGLPVSILEAMAMARPVITTDVPGNRDAVVHEQTGLIVPSGDAPALAAAMARLLDEPSLGPAWGAAGRARACARFAHDVVNTSLLTHLGL